MNKVYLVSEIQCFSTEVMQKRFWVFSSLDKALAFKNNLDALWIHDLLEGSEYDSLEEMEDNGEITIVHMGPLLFNFIGQYGEPEVEIQISTLSVDYAKEC